jgi:hypothetical protein
MPGCQEIMKHASVSMFAYLLLLQCNACSVDGTGLLKSSLTACYHFCDIALTPPQNVFMCFMTVSLNRD